MAVARGGASIERLDVAMAACVGRAGRTAFGGCDRADFHSRRYRSTDSSAAINPVFAYVRILWLTLLPLVIILTVLNSLVKSRSPRERSS